MSEVRAHRGKGQVASVSTDEISRIMDMPAGTARPVALKNKSEVRLEKWRDRAGGVGTDRMNEGYLMTRLEMCLLS